MPTLPQLAVLGIAIVFGCACEGGKSSSHTKFAKSCANGCERGQAGPSSRSGVSRGGVSERAAGGADDRDDEESGPRFDEPFTGAAGSGGIFGGVAGAAGSGAGFAGPSLPPVGGAGAGGSGFPTGGFGPTAGFDGF